MEYKSLITIRLTTDAYKEAKGSAKKILADAQNAFGKAEECVRDSFESIESHVKERPVHAALVALGIGFLFGKILG